MRSSGTEPDEGDGKVQLLLSESSGELLSKVDGVKRWRVQPTMVRGWKKTNSIPLHVGKGCIKSKLKRGTHASKKGLKSKKETQDEDGTLSKTKKRKLIATSHKWRQLLMSQLMTSVEALTAMRPSSWFFRRSMRLTPRLSHRIQFLTPKDVAGWSSKELLPLRGQRCWRHRLWHLKPCT